MPIFRAFSLPGRRKRRGRILALKWGMNPNSSSLGVDVTFLLFGAAALAMATPVLSAMIRWRRPAIVAGAAAPTRAAAPAQASPQPGSQTPHAGQVAVSPPGEPGDEPRQEHSDDLA